MPGEPVNDMRRSADHNPIFLTSTVAGAVLLGTALFTAHILWIQTVATVLFLSGAGAAYLLRRSWKARAVERQRLEQRVSALEKELETMRTEQQRTITAEKIAAISKFSSVMAHEVKNPLASLKNIVYFLTKAVKDPDEKIRKMLEMMSGELDRTNALVNDLTDLSRIRRVNRVATPLHELVTALAGELKLGDSIPIALELEEVSAPIDPDKVKLALTNLLTNARDAMPGGGQVRIQLKKNGSVIELAVTDAGTGMDPETVSHIFEPMFTTKTKVLGLGLTVVKEIVALHNGVIEVASEKGKGSTFKITLPLE